MIETSTSCDETEVDRVTARLRARLGTSATVAISPVGDRWIVEGSVPTFYHKQLVVNALLKATAAAIDAEGLAVG